MLHRDGKETEALKELDVAEKYAPQNHKVRLLRRTSAAAAWEKRRRASGVGGGEAIVWVVLDKIRQGLTSNECRVRRWERG